jgi:signal peptidase II
MPKKIAVNPWLFLTLIALGIDQISKYWTVSHLEFNEIYVITPFFNWTLTYNPGAAFSFLSDSSGWQVWFFLGISVVVSFVILLLLLQTDKRYKWHSVALSFILAGAIGNAIDRIRLQQVIDFLQWHYHGWYWPTFNFADTWVVTGVIMWIIEEVFFSDERQKNNRH